MAAGTGLRAGAGDLLGRLVDDRLEVVDGDRRGAAPRHSQQRSGIGHHGEAVPVDLLDVQPEVPSHGPLDLAELMDVEARQVRIVVHCLPSMEARVESARPGLSVLADARAARQRVGERWANPQDQRDLDLHQGSAGPCAVSRPLTGSSSPRGKDVDHVAEGRGMPLPTRSPVRAATLTGLAVGLVVGLVAGLVAAVIPPATAGPPPAGSQGPDRAVRADPRRAGHACPPTSSRPARRRARWRRRPTAAPGPSPGR